MSGICGWSGRAAGAPVARDAIERMAAVLGQLNAGACRVRVENDSAAACTGYGGSFGVHADDELLAVYTGRMRVGNTPGDAGTSGDLAAAALARAFRERGPECLGALTGAFALAIMNQRSGETVLAVDRMGIHQLCYAAAGDTLVFGSRLEAIAAFPGMAARVDCQALYDYAYFHMVPAPRTVFRDHHRLLPGTFLVWRNGRTEIRPYWEMRYTENDRRSFSELKETFLSLLRESVREAAVEGVTGTFLSGGTDSSTVAGMLTEVTGKPARTYSIGFEAQGYDEMAFARIAARHFGTSHHEYYVTPDDVVRAIPEIAAAHDQPYGNASAVPTYYCAKLAREDGTEALLGGDGGDELFGGNDRYAKQHLYSLYSDLPQALRKRLIEPVAFMTPEIGIAGKVQRYIRNASLPMPARYDYYNLLERLGPANVFTAGFLETVDPAAPREQTAKAYHGAHADSLINRMLALDLRYTLADNDLPKVVRSCELARVDARFPLLADSIVAFSARLAPRLKLRGTRLRYFFKEALRGFLPDEIITKTKHGFGLPFGRWLQAHRPLQHLAMDSLTDLKRRDIVRPEFIDELTALRVASHADYYGTMVWVLMMLEQWLKHHRPAIR
jgi:asparagine synthase (glutamine-hydrolysing)